MSGIPPLHDGRQPLTSGWTIDLPFPMARRIEDGALVFWHSPLRLTLWLNAYDAPGDLPDLLAFWKDQRSPASFDEIEERAGTLLRYAYRLAESADDDREPAFYGFAGMAAAGYIQLAAYFDDPAHLEDIEATWRSLSWAA